MAVAGFNGVKERDEAMKREGAVEMMSVGVVNDVSEGIVGERTGFGAGLRFSEF